MTTSRYDPHQHADDLGLTVIYRPLRTDNGLFIPDLDVIFLRPRMHKVLERSVLAHEIAHHVLAHRSTAPKFEVQANRYAAAKLIDPVRFDDLRRERPGQPTLWCAELEVSPQILQAWLGPAS
jgi:Zn-dependent peptidase ImmA (M78 family)